MLDEEEDILEIRIFKDGAYIGAMIGHDEASGYGETIEDALKDLLDKWDLNEMFGDEEI